MSETCNLQNVQLSDDIQNIVSLSQLSCADLHGLSYSELASTFGISEVNSWRLKKQLTESTSGIQQSTNPESRQSKSVASTENTVSTTENTEEEFGTRVRNRWFSQECQNFYAEEEVCKVRNSTARSGNWSRPKKWLQQTCTREDLAYGGRDNSVVFGERSAMPLAWEAVISHEYKFVYLENRKAASQTLRWILGEVFGAGMSRRFCEEGLRDAQLKERTHCTTLHITEEMLTDYFFFSYVRDPVSRFWSALAQVIVHEMVVLDWGNCSEHIEDIVGVMMQSNAVIDAHLASQATMLSSPLLHPATRALSPLEWHTGMLALDFVEDSELLAASFPALLRRIEANAGKPLSPALRARAIALASERTNSRARRPRLASQLAACRTPQLDQLLRRAYAQDYACGFGTGL